MRKLESQRFLVGLVAAVTLAAVGSARAAVVTTYTDLTAWQAAAGSPIVLEDFADAALQPGLTITFGTNSAQPGTISGGVYFDTALTQFNDSGNPRLSFSPSTLAMGADWDLSFGGTGDGLVFALLFADNTSGQLTIVNPVSGTFIDAFVGFFGFVSDTAVTSFRLDSPGTGQERFAMDNLRFRGTSGGTVPEPGTLALIALAMLSLSAARVRQRLCLHAGGHGFTLRALSRNAGKLLGALMSPLPTRFPAASQLTWREK